MNAIIVGVGSIGLNHLDFLIDRYGSCAVVDTSSAALLRAKEKFGRKVEVFGTIEEAVRSLYQPEHVTAVIANLGPDHLETAMKLINVGIKKIYLEKPMATSIDDCARLIDISKISDTRVVIGFQRRGSGLAGAVNTLAEKYGIGKPTSILVHGGALDMSTTGIHWLDFATEIFQGAPISVLGAGSRAAINPRSPELFFWDGSITWEFKLGQRLTQVFDNRSSLSSEVVVYCRDGIIRVGDGYLELGIRDKGEIEKFPQITRCGAVSDSWRVSNFALELKDGREELFRRLEGTEDIHSSLVESAKVTSALWAGLWSLENGKSVDLPVSRSHESYFVKWRAS